MVAITVLACLILAALVAVIAIVYRSLRFLRHIDQFILDCEEVAEEEADRRLDDEESEQIMDSEEETAWICDCGNYQGDGFHCDVCNSEPPWGCDCGNHQSHEDDEEFWEPDYEGEQVP